MSEYTNITTKCGEIKGLDRGEYSEFLGIRYATARRFQYATPVTHWDGIYDATKHGKVCIQNRTWYEHLEIPQRYFYYNEFRKGQTFDYDEDCLNLNIWAPKEKGCYPVLIFIHGGGFDSGANYDSAIDGAAYAKRGIVCVSIHYRVSVFGYFTHEKVKKAYGREGNFGLDDQLTAIRWVKDNISDYMGDANNITLMGQSAGAISIQYLCLSEKCKGLFQRAIMMSGGGLFPKFALPRQAENTREYWLDLMQTCGAKDFEDFRTMDPHKIFTGIEELKQRRKDNTFNTMPVVDGYLIEKPIDEMIDHPLDIDYMIGYTNNDMYAIIMSKIGHDFIKKNGGYIYYFDIDAPGSDDNAAFHSADIRYVFGTLDKSHRPYGPEDYKASKMMMDYICAFARTGNPNTGELPQWEKTGKKALHITTPTDKIKMGHPSQWELLVNTITKGDPK